MRIAQKRVEGFALQFGEAHRNLARHSAFPLVLTPDLLYQIWANFVPEAPWTAIAHVLLSRLCRQVGYEIYEIDITDRNLLLQELKQEFGQERFDELGEFLLDYMAQRLTDDDINTQDLREATEWTVLAYTKPDEVAQELAQALSRKVKLRDMEEVLQLTSLTEALAEPLREAGFTPLLVYSRGIESFVRGDLEDATVEFKKISGQRRSVEVAGVILEPLYTDIQADVQKYGLTCREAEVWFLHRNKYSYKEIADKLFVTINTVKKHMKNIYAKHYTYTEQQASPVTIEKLVEIDEKLSQRHINLDPGGYFIIYLDREAGLICAKHFTNVINERGLAVDPETKKVIHPQSQVERIYSRVFSGRTAKELCVKIFEETQPCPVTQLDHAAYLGREFVRSELALVTQQEYVQD